MNISIFLYKFSQNLNCLTSRKMRIASLVDGGSIWRLPTPNMPLEDEGSVKLLLYCIRDNTLQLWSCSCSEKGGSVILQHEWKVLRHID